MYTINLNREVFERELAQTLSSEAVTNIKRALTIFDFQIEPVTKQVDEWPPTVTYSIVETLKTPHRGAEQNRARLSIQFVSNVPELLAKPKIALIPGQLTANCFSPVPPKDSEEPGRERALSGKEVWGALEKQVDQTSRESLIFRLLAREVADAISRAAAVP